MPQSSTINTTLPLILEEFATFTFTFQGEAVVDSNGLTFGKLPPIDRTYRFVFQGEYPKTRVLEPRSYLG